MALAGVAWCLTAFAVAATLAHHLVAWTWHRGMIDRPHRRRIHARPTPRGGGLAIIAVAAAAAAVTAWQMPVNAARIAAACLPAVAVALVGWWDDITPRPTSVRLAVQVVAAVMTVWFLGPMTAIASALSVAWLVGLTNVVNFLDGSDGLAGMTGAIVAGCLGCAAAMTGESALAAIAAAVAAGCLGFLTCNWEPARIFMGDVGSTGCGFLLAALPLAASPEDVPVLVPVVAAAAWPLIADAMLTLLGRLWRRENIFTPHHEHIYQQLVLGGWSHQAVAVVYGGLAAAGGLVALICLGELR
jgi:UDP-N-acetylmuramyl pentapeptide phosphotransferase/UDP-N-acetylglucosamine-1-phosphate transferase